MPGGIFLHLGSRTIFRDPRDLTALGLTSAPLNTTEAHCHLSLQPSSQRHKALLLFQALTSAFQLFLELRRLQYLINGSSTARTFPARLAPASLYPMSNSAIRVSILSRLQTRSVQIAG